MLTLISTPIGNLQDISQRALSSLSACDILLCEDTRQSTKLLSLLRVPIPKLMSLHRFNESSRQDEILALLQEGKHIGLVSDAGTPGICDPGSALIEQCHKKNIPVTIIPGPCAFAAAYALSGSTQERMQFVGFLPKKKEELLSLFQEILYYPGITLAYESPHRLQKTLSLLVSTKSDWEIAVMRELTKLHEEIIRSTASALSDHFSAKTIKGECTLCLFPSPQTTSISSADALSQIKNIRTTFSCSLKEAIELVAKQIHMPQRELYQLCIASTHDK